jgi:hypothetical protein
MEDDLKYLKIEDNHNFFQMEDDLKYLKIEDNHIFFEWKTTYFF